MEFCQCGSIKVDNSCTNKKCSHFTKKVENATSRQIDSIKDLLNQLGREESEVDFGNLSKQEAKELIDELQGQLEAEDEQ